MLNITDAASFARALDSPLSEPIKTLLRLRRDQLPTDAAGQDMGDLAQFVVVDISDDISAIEAAAGYPVVTQPAFEWVADHGGLFEAPTVLNDDGFAVVLLCPDDPAVDADLLTLLRDQATPADLEDPDATDREHSTSA